MKQQYRIVRNPKALSDEQIDRHKDFNKLLDNYGKVHKHGTLTKPFFRNFGIFSLVMIVGVIVLLLLLDKEEKDEAEKKGTITTSDTTSKDSDASNTTTTPDVVIDAHGTPTVVKRKSDNTSSVSQIRWDYVIEFDPTKDFTHQLANGVRVLIDANSLETAAGKPLTETAELLYRATAEFSEKVEAKFRKEEFEIRIREKKSATMASLTNPAVVEYPVALDHTPIVYQLNEPKGRWNKTASELTFRFEINAGQAPYTLLEHHVWEFQNKASSLRVNQNIFVKSWRQLEWNTASTMLLKGTQGSAKLTDARPARVYASKKRQKEFEEKLFNCYSKKGDDLCAGNTRTTLWKTPIEMCRLNTATASFEVPQTGIFLIDCNKTTTSALSEKFRAITIESYPVDTRNGNIQENEN